jgi:DNA replication protein DnaC
VNTGEPLYFSAIVSQRYKKGSILMTNNRDLITEWPELFSEPLLASAGLDRLTHHAHMFIITGQSYRAHGEDKEVPV